MNLNPEEDGCRTRISRFAPILGPHFSRSDTAERGGMNFSSQSTTRTKNQNRQRIPAGALPILKWLPD